jgi:serine protease AprX
MATYRAKIESGFAPKADRYGHGSHVAAVAAGRGTYQTVDTTGMAPNANLFDVRVLDDNGYGQLSDVLAGIDWVLYYAKFKNIRVMNLSLGADSTESYRTDPLARAVRSAVAQGIVVVVAAGNFGLNAAGKESYGTISSPGHEPSVITVGSVNLKGTISRKDDVVNQLQLARAHARLRCRRKRRAPGRQPAQARPGGPRQPHRRPRWPKTRPAPVAPGTCWPRKYPDLSKVGGAGQAQDKALMMLSGTSVAAPVVSRRGGADAGGQPRPDAADGQGHPAVHRADRCRRQPGAAGRRPAQHRRRGAPGAARCATT